MAYEIYSLGDGRDEVRITTGHIMHIARTDGGKWTVEEDAEHREFSSRGAALDRARDLAGDVDG